VRYRKLDENGDYVFGHGNADFLIDSPDTVRQLIETRLALHVGEWFLDETSGTAWDQIIGKGTNKTYDLVIQTRILQTQGVDKRIGILQYQSSVDPDSRSLTIAALMQTIYSGEPVVINKTVTA
jgi:hypothetical protein